MGLREVSREEQALSDPVDSVTFLERANSWLRAAFFTGLLVIIPPAFSLLVLYWMWGFVDALVIWALPSSLSQSLLVRLGGSAFGILAVLSLVVLAGAAAQTFIGSRARRFYERLLVKLPLVGRVFTWIQQISEMVFTDKREVFSKVALVEYPRKGLWTLAFLSSPASDEMRRKSQHELVSLFVPTTPNPTSGFLIMIPVSELILLDLAPEEALKIILSGGIISPPQVPESSVGHSQGR